MITMDVRHQCPGDVLGSLVLIYIHIYPFNERTKGVIPLRINRDEEVSTGQLFHKTPYEEVKLEKRIASSVLCIKSSSGEGLDENLYPGPYTE